MTPRIATLWDLLRGDVTGGRVVPPSGLSAWLVIATAAVMAFVAVLALILALTADRIGKEWRSALELSATIVIDAGDDTVANAERRVRDVIATTKGVNGVRRIDVATQREILSQWFGDGLVEYNLPTLLALDLEPDIGREGLRNLELRLRADVPEAGFDDHGAWRVPLVTTARRIEGTGQLLVLAVLAALVCVIAIAARAAISANNGNIRTLRLIGADDQFIARAFVRRTTLRSLLGAVLGTAFGCLATFFIFSNDALPTLSAVDWLKCVGLVPLVGLISFVATRIAVTTSLRRIS